ncbi:hypothetical protein ES332_A12G095400v1 [Gossypium tomentosum]|uniref:hAT-like transposase RNase-H fold domain-containing protein n=1 Tax=Gossypium tomentosum TaxID=34277 RepID=A0A5D2MUT4_GOSTO|nr:hypothetical protein ES332_A12G095400v1 [Gossypium tomentosum]
MAVIKGNEIFNAHDTTHERPTLEEAKCLDDIEVTTYTRINTKKISIIKLAKNKDGTTTQYKRHLDGFVKHQVSLKGQGNLFLPPQAPRSDSANGIQTWKYDQANIRELPFAFTKYELFTLLMKISSPHHKSYEVEKKRLNRLLKIMDKISNTTNMWKLGQKIQYMKCLQNWGIKGKVCLIFVGSASYNDAVVRMLKDSLSFHKRLPLNGKLFHVHCCAHILNLLVYDGLSKIEDVINNEVCSFLALFNEVNNIISGSKYPTSNLFLPKLWSIKELLMEKSLSEELSMRQMVDKMQIKFDKYWVECSLLISIAAILDPSNKMKLIYFSFCVIYSEEEAPRQIHIVRDSLYELYKEYVMNMQQLIIGRGKVMTRRSKFERYIRSVDKVGNVKFELVIYLEGVFIFKENYSDFDALEWWKVNNLNTLASEYAFSAGGRVIDVYRSSLGTDMMKMLLYGSNWYWNFYGLKKKAKVSNFQVFVLFI